MKKLRNGQTVLEAGDIVFVGGADTMIRIDVDRDGAFSIKSSRGFIVDVLGKLLRMAPRGVPLTFAVAEEKDRTSEIRIGPR